MTAAFSLQEIDDCIAQVVLPRIQMEALHLRAAFSILFNVEANFQSIVERGLQLDCEFRKASGNTFSVRKDSSESDVRTVASIPESGTVIIVGNALVDLGKSFFLKRLPRWKHAQTAVMLSPTGSSYKRHFDLQDNFVVQLRGKKEWTFDTEPSLPGAKDKAAQRTVVLEAGDFLYLPPRYSHSTRTVDDSISVVLSFDVYSMREILTPFTEFLHRNHDPYLYVEDKDSFQDSGLFDPRFFGSCVKKKLIEVIKNFDDESFGEWMGRDFASRRLYEQPWEDEDAFRKSLDHLDAQGGQLVRQRWDAILPVVTGNPRSLGSFVYGRLRSSAENIGEALANQIAKGEKIELRPGQLADLNHDEFQLITNLLWYRYYRFPSKILV